MTLVTIDVSDVASETHPDDRVIFWAPRHRPGTSTAKHAQRLADGIGEVELKPGPTMVQFQCRGIADTEPKLGTIPESGTATLDDVLDPAWEYSPEVVRAAQQARDDAREYRDQARTAASGAADEVEQRLADYTSRSESAAASAQEGADRIGSAERVLEAEDTSVNAAADAEEYALQAATAVGPRRIDLVAPTQAQIDSTLAALPAGSTVMNLSTGEVWGQ